MARMSNRKLFLVLRSTAFVTFAALAIPMTSPGAIAQNYPNRPIRLIVPFAPGGGTDIVARLLAQHLSQRLSQSFVIENQPAGSGIVGSNYVARAAPDGYTLLFAFSSLASSAKLVSKLPYWWSRGWIRREGRRGSSGR